MKQLNLNQNSRNYVNYLQKRQFFSTKNAIPLAEKECKQQPETTLLGLAIFSMAYVKAALAINRKNILKTIAANPDKITLRTEQAIQETGKKADKVQANIDKSKLISAETIGNGRIKATFQNGNQTNTIEMPEYLYHFTSSTAMKKIQDSGVIKCSLEEQMPGVFFLDSKNFMKYYGDYEVNGEDLITRLLKHANFGNENVPFDQQNLVVIKIPTKDLLEQGKLRIRKQEDYFSALNKIKSLQEGSSHNFTVRNLSKDENKELFIKYVLDNNLMSEKELDKFLQNITQKLHYGFTVQNAARLNLEATDAIEYIFKNEIELQKFPNIKTKTIALSDYIDNHMEKADYKKLDELFNSSF